MATAFSFAAAPLPFMHPDNMPDVYAVEGDGVYMEPVVSNGAVLVFDRREAPAVGDTVSVIFKREHATRYGYPALVKRLSLDLPPWVTFGSNVAGLIVVEQLNPPRTYTIPSSHVLAVHKCVGIGEAAGSGRARYNPNQEAPR